MVTFNCKAGDSLNADKDCDKLLHCIELEVVVDQAHPVAMVCGACLGTRVTFYIVDAAEVDEGNNDNDDCSMALCTSIVLLLLLVMMMMKAMPM